MSEKRYRIGDAAELLGLKTYVLRYWETEFSELAPTRTGKGQRRYTETDVALLQRIRYLLHDQGMTIEGARRVLTGASELAVSAELPSLTGPVRQPKTASKSAQKLLQRQTVAGTDTPQLQLPLTFSPASSASPDGEQHTVQAAFVPEPAPAASSTGHADPLPAIARELRALQDLLRRGPDANSEHR